MCSDSSARHWSSVEGGLRSSSVSSSTPRLASVSFIAPELSPSNGPSSVSAPQLPRPHLSVFRSWALCSAGHFRPLSVSVLQLSLSLSLAFTHALHNSHTVWHRAPTRPSNSPTEQQPHRAPINTRMPFMVNMPQVLLTQPPEL